MSINLTKDGAKRLANAIVIQCIEDLKSAYMGNRVEDTKTPEQTIKECEEFLRSDYCRELVSLDGDYMIYNTIIELLGEHAKLIQDFLDDGRAHSITLTLPKTKAQPKTTYVLPPSIRRTIEEKFQAVVVELSKEQKRIKKEYRDLRYKRECEIEGEGENESVENAEEPKIDDLSGENVEMDNSR